MNSFSLVKLFLVMAVVTISLVACVKHELPPAQKYNLPPSPLKVEAVITDLGLVNNTSRKLMVAIKGLQYELTNNYGTFLQSGSLIQIGFFSGMDGFIPSGKYTYSDSTINLPFTFNDAFLSISGSYIRITSGSITVDSYIPKYRLLFDCGLSDGESFTATYYDTMRYSDSY